MRCHILRLGFWGIALLACSPAAFAQQNLFNVPSGAITGKGNLFFQEQFNFSEPVGQSNTTFDFGLGNGWEVGLNVLDVVLYEDFESVPGLRHQENPDFLFNFQKGIVLIEDVWTVGVGGQFGFNPARNHDAIRFENFTWATNAFEVPDHPEWGKWYCGPYVTNIAYAGLGNRVGAMLGGEIPLIPERFAFQFDYLSGHHDISVLVVGGVYTLHSGWQLSVGGQLPAPGSGNPTGLVIEMTCPSYPLASRRGVHRGTDVLSHAP